MPGLQQIEAWLTGPASEYTYTTEFDVVQRLEGNVPGGVADLHFRFFLDGGLIGCLVMEP
ncbi:MAG: hypothetical protein ABWY45_19985 [Mycobacterium sp.]